MSSYQLMLLLAVSLLLVQLSESGWHRLRRRGCSPVNCEWNNWSEWGVCNHPCGSAGSQNRSRSVRRGSSCGGAGCTGGSTSSQACNRFCHNGGSPMEGYCTCPDVFWGTCCGERIVTPKTSTGGAVYIRWGRKVCPQNGAELLYSGIAAGSHYTLSGGGSNYLCLPRDPEWGKTVAGFQSGGYLAGAEYEMYSNNPFSEANAKSLQDNDVPCAVCYVPTRPSKLMIPAKLSCPPMWTKEYSGYLMAEYYAHRGRTTYVCVDNAPEVIQGGAAIRKGALFYNTEAFCGSLPCPSYVNGWEITCVVCSR
ncbi:hypothetical protein NP493_1058g00002 [Ridgeia piscesae]|uniref:Uncharacterized protein n=1 Tax=Ridgeia piscesae TaxID=27915 RepID=A0AAD9KHX9_RIDPI|nr:hypothetical protein NP493_1058g00002 [Ridgeia piscesae]